VPGTLVRCPPSTSSLSRPPRGPQRGRPGNREAATRFDFKNTDSVIELGDNELVLTSSTEDRLRALHQVLEEKLVKRQVSLKSLDDGKIEEASKVRRARRSPSGGIDQEHAKRLNKFIKDLGLKGVSSQTR